MHPPKITLLDLGGVVFQSTGSSSDKIKWDIISQLNKKYAPELDRGVDKFSQFLLEYNRLTAQSLSGEMFLEAVFDTLSFNHELIKFIRQQSDIIIVSDNYRENIAYISKRYYFDQWAIQQIYSYEYQMVKASPAFFQRLLEELDEYSAEQLLFIDDNQKNITHAAQFGIAGILYQNNEQLKQKWIERAQI